MNQETKEQSALLTQFYQAYAGWLDAGAPNGVLFRRRYGLCTSFSYWSEVQKLTLSELGSCYRELQRQFRHAGLNEQYPFNRGDWVSFRREQDFEMAHENPERIKWVRDHAQ